MRVIGLTVENFLRVEAAEITPTGDMVVIAGPNEAGKSTLINAVWVALGGADVAPEKPIRDGAERAQITLEIGDGEGPVLVVERVFTAGGMRLKVTERREDGASVTFAKPQAILSAMLSGIAFDPEAFARMPAREQAELLAALTGLDTADLDAEYDRVFAERRDVNRDAKAMGECSMPQGERPEGVDVTALMADLDAADAANREREARAGRRQRALEEAEGWETEARRLVDRADELRKEADQLAQRADGLIQDAGSSRKRLADAEPLPDPIDTAPIRERLAGAESRNAEQRAYDDAVIRAEALAAKVSESEALTTRLDGIKTKRAERVAAVAMPVEGLSIEEGVVHFEGVPFSQASAARRLDISLAIGMAQHPKLRVLRIENGSLLDKRMMEVIEARCAEHGFQAWIERVADSDEGVGIYIEDGRIATKETSE